MLFNSFEFLVFFILVTAVYFAIPFKYKWLHLLVASCIFYMFFIPIYILILFFTIIIDYYAGLAIENASTPQKRKALLIISLISNIGILCIFKYYNFFVENINNSLIFIGSNYDVPLLKIVLPIGLSFHTFQAMSYTIEVYRGNQIAEKHFGIYSLYVMFYPQLVAGPIERPQNILHQFKIDHKFNYEEVKLGLLQILWGVIKKVMIADRFAPIVNEVYNKHEEYGGMAIIFATLFFAIQIYCDFSGYSDIALGSARVMGFRLMKNFDTPYFSRSITEFWRRWHISLSTWFRDYVYIPLGGNRTTKSKWYFNLFTVFLLSGLWHGANWTFVLWGGLLGVGLILEASSKTLRLWLENKLSRYVFNSGARILTLAFICLSWLIFRSTSIKNLVEMISSIFTSRNFFHLSKNNLSGVAYLGQPLWKFTSCFILIGILFTVEYFHKKTNLVNSFTKYPQVVQWGVLYAAIISILIFGSFTTNEFIYFQF